MEKNRKFSIQDRIKSFGHAFAGLWDMLRSEHNAWVHAAATIIVVALSLWLRLDAVRFSLIVLAIVGVWIAEAFNTVFELLTNIVSPNYSHEARRAKDIAAAAVLIASFGAVILGLFILGPPLYERLQGMG